MIYTFHVKAINIFAVHAIASAQIIRIIIEYEIVTKSHRRSHPFEVGRKIRSNTQIRKLFNNNSNFAGEYKLHEMS